MVGELPDVEWVEVPESGQDGSLPGDLRGADTGKRASSSETCGCLDPVLVSAEETPSADGAQIARFLPWLPSGEGQEAPAGKRARLYEDHDEAVNQILQLLPWLAGALLPDGDDDCPRAKR